MSARVQTWPRDLAALIERRRHMPFRFGMHDCCQFARAAIEAQTGEDPAALLRLASYRRRAHAAAELRRLGGIAALPAAAGLAPIAPGIAGRGAIGLQRYESPRPGMAPLQLEALGVCLGIMSAFPGRRGLVFNRTLGCIAAWRIT
jgi:hypothetical protein